ncbi:major facilitator superfamily domain-containing protein [Fomitopsis serialis]|uniref:major facilitator superfamily domain-containing protein n=1 Tax=Fomitopsis serialis TaxID=139415 RepID=UPI0020085933|nr:major facilitator superfamily domain-containing protein [Neoantrodia serialis]KAH9938655.1 major facilitator superfamily domain-containing protein [Neoantrodia serialis]
MSSRSSDTVFADQEKQQARGGVNAWEKDPERQKADAPEPSSNTDGTGTSASEPPDDDEYAVTLGPEDDPKRIGTGRKWLITLVICNAALCATFASSIASFTETGLQRDLHTVREVTVLSISLYVQGLALGPLLFAPLSEVYGRNNVYRISYFLFWVFTWPIAFPPDIETFLVFRFLTGFSSSAFLSVAGGSVSDLFDNRNVATPMGVYTLSPFFGPVLGPLISGFICQNTNWHWAYRVCLIYEFVTLVSLLLFVPETYVPVLLKRKAARLRKETGNGKYWAPLDRREGSITHSIMLSIYTPFKLMFFDKMALSLNTWNSLTLGILYLTFEAFPVIFGDVHGFTYQETGLAFLGMGIGMFGALSTQGLWNRYHHNVAARHGGKLPPETRLVMGMVGGVLAPIGLFWLAFTTYRAVPWIIPIIASSLFGAAVYFIFTSTFTYLVTAYRPIAASAMASNTALRCTFAAAFPLFAVQMYDRLTTVGATALLAADLCLRFLYYRWGERLRAQSKFAAVDL